MIILGDKVQEEDQGQDKDVSKKLSNKLKVVDMMLKEEM